MKKLIRKFAIYVLCFIGIEVGAANVSVTGEGRIRHEIRNNSDFNSTIKDYLSSTSSRFRADVLFTADENKKIFLQPQFTKTWGAPAGTSGVLSDTDFSVHQAYIEFAGVEKLYLKAGRQEIVYGDQLLVGNVGWSNVGRAFDAFKLQYVFESSLLDIFTSKITETNSTAASLGDKDFSGIYYAHKLDKAFLQEVDFYAFSVLDSTVYPKNQNIFAYGIRTKGHLSLIDYRAEYTQESIDKEAASQIDIELGYEIASRHRIGAEYFNASKLFNQLFPTGHKWLGVADLFSRKNIIGFQLSYAGELSNDHKLTVSYFQFNRVDTNVDGFNFSGTGYGTIGNEAAMASEVDLVLTCIQDQNLSYQFGVSKVAPGPYFKDNNLSDSFDFYYLQLLMKM